MTVERDEFRRCAPGLGAIAVVCAPVLWTSLGSPSPFRASQLIAWWITVAAFSAVFFVIVTRRLPRPATFALIAAESILALTANWLIPMGLAGVALTGILLAVASATFARLPRAVAVILIVVQTAALFAIYLWPSRWPLGIALSASTAYGLMQFIIESTWRLATLERARRVELEGAMRELRSTQAMLAETVRAAQRSEIARNLHDVVGHHLVALGLQLDAATGQATEPSDRERLAASRELVRSVLSSVREVVAGLRDNDAVDLGAALGSLATDGPGPRVTVRIDERAPRMTSDLAETLLRCAQEALTNARKHAGASTVTIELGPDRLLIADDGRGIGDAAPGFGLESMRARCTAQGCELSIRSSPTGTTVEIRWDIEAGP